MGMNVFMLSAPEITQWVSSKNFDDIETINTLGTLPVSTTWTPLKLEVAQNTIHDTRVDVDMPYFGSDVLLLRSSAMHVLHPILEPFGEFLPIYVDEKEVNLFHCLNYVDALLQDESEIKYFPDGKRVMFIRRYEFDAEKVRRELVFRIPQWRRVSRLFFSDQFRLIVESAGLTGTTFRPVWSSQARPNSEQEDLSLQHGKVDSDQQ